MWYMLVDDLILWVVMINEKTKLFTFIETASWSNVCETEWQDYR